MNTYNHFAYQNADPAYYAQLKEWAKKIRSKPTEAESILRDYVELIIWGISFFFNI